MSNPYPKPPAGSYRAPLEAGLRKLGLHGLADQIKRGDIRLGNVASFYGPVKRLDVLTPQFIEALKQTDDDVARFYVWSLENGETAPADPSGAYVYDQKDPEQAAYAAARIAEDKAKVYAPGELFMRS